MTEQNNLVGLLPDVLPEMDNNFDPLPVGDYLVVITDAELKPTKANDGFYINLKMQVLNGQYEQRLLFSMINIQNKSEAATKIGLAQFGALKNAIGEDINDTSQLIDKIVKVKVGIQPAEGQYQAKNTIKRYMAQDTASAPAPTVSEPKASAPWETKV